VRGGQLKVPEVGSSADDQVEKTAEQNRRIESPPMLSRRRALVRQLLETGSIT
jgi:hypothetical protein